jgi:hypothetical protein
MLAGAYLIGPAPAATTALTASAAAPPIASAPPISTIKTIQAPVPLLVGRHDQYFDESAVTDTAVSGQAAPATTDNAQPAASGVSSDSAAKTSIEMDGYRNVRDLVRGSDGVWHGRAMRGSTEIAVRVDGAGSVSAD